MEFSTDSKEKEEKRKRQCIYNASKMIDGIIVEQCSSTANEVIFTNDEKQTLDVDDLIVKDECDSDPLQGYCFSSV